MKKIANKVLAKTGFTVRKEYRFKDLLQLEKDYGMIFDLALNSFGENLRSYSQIYQDVMALLLLGGKRNGFFVEFGATNGVKLSNTYLLEKDFGWSGILAEPAKVWHEELKKNRNVIVDHRCVWKKSKEKLSFNTYDDAELSTISEFSGSDYHKRKSANSYMVETISLNDLLNESNAPKVIDYMSVDTEGSEYDILQALDFNTYEFKVITCEHNKNPDREKIYELLSNNGYERVVTGLSRWDDWYIKPKYISEEIYRMFS